MKMLLKATSGFTAMLSSVVAQAQVGAAAAASAPPVEIRIPDDPAWFIAGLATGLIAGFLGAKLQSFMKNK